MPFLSLYLHCDAFDPDHDPTYPMLYQRCMLMDSTWLAGVLVTLLWLSATFLSIQHHRQHKLRQHQEQTDKRFSWLSPVPERNTRRPKNKLETLPSAKLEQPFSFSSSLDTIAVAPHGLQPPPALNSPSKSSLSARISQLHHHFTSIDLTSAASQLLSSNNTAPSSPSVANNGLIPFSYLPTKALPPLKRDSDDTLCLPIHGSNYMPSCSPTFLDEPPPPSHHSSIHSDHLSLHQPLDEKLELSGELTQMDSVDSFSRRQLVAKSCPEFTKKKVFHMARLSSDLKGDAASVHF
ncbi:hypothetical protein DM01DRAFT_299102 [Hesseltinella vesiculosa]|uniref:Uncharacterized protein n=1 Tax=Hesseltinella vesiculosa TaxID=101127 RepID=A0A1X2G4N5_9FUNG|nr:hypothetical protein DM01DRAFT_299102 [Hesseltinella vesiculosa]